MADSAELTPPAAPTVAVASPPEAEDRPELVLEVIDDVDGLAALRPDWERLERFDATCTPFNTWLWASLWWRHYGDGHALHVVVFREPGGADGRGGRAVALAPLHERVGGALGAIVLRWIGSGGDTSPDYLGLLAEPAARARAERAVVVHVFGMPRWRRLHLSDVADPSSLADTLDAALAGARGTRLGGRVNAIHVGRLPASWEDYRHAIGRKRRKQINHRRNRLDAAGRSVLAIARTPTEVAEATEALIRLHRLRWKSKGEAGAFASHAYVEFHRAVIEGFFARDALWLATLRLDDEIIGVQYVFRWNDTLEFFQSGYSPAHERLGPGHVLFTFVIGEGIAQGLRRVDMLKGDYEYKSVYARQLRHTRDFLFVRPGPHAVLARARRRVRRLIDAWSRHRSRRSI